MFAASIDGDVSHDAALEFCVDAGLSMCSVENAVSLLQEY